MRDAISNHTVVNLGELALSGTTPGVSDYVDTRGYDSVSIVLLTGTVTDAGTVDGFTAVLEESADTTGAAASAVVAADTVNLVNTIQVTADTDDNVNAGGMGYNGTERYVGATVTGTAGTDANVTVLAILHRPHRAPADFVGTSVART